MIEKRRLSLLLAIGLLLVAVRRVDAGMPAVTFSELATLRLETISFFGAVVLAASAVVQWIWNSLACDFSRLPRLGYVRAVGLVVLWGLLFGIVLLMISGARELLTPGAWERDGATYRLAPPAAAAPPSDESLEWKDAP